VQDRAAAEPVVRGRRRRRRGRGARDPARTRTHRTGRARRVGRTAQDRAGRPAPRARRRTRQDHRAPSGRQDHRARPDGRDRPDRPGHPVRRTRLGLRARQDPTARRRTGVPAGSARRDGSSARGGSSGSRRRHRRRRTGRAVAAAGTGGTGSRRGPDRGHRGLDRAHPDRAHPDPDPGRVPTAGVRPGCTSWRCWSGSSTGTPRRRARRPRGACGTAGRVRSGRRGAGARRDPRGRDRPRPGAGQANRAAGIRNRRP
jgi:hypothetical protein